MDQEKNGKKNSLAVEIVYHSVEPPVSDFMYTWCQAQVVAYGRWSLKGSFTNSNLTDGLTNWSGFYLGGRLWEVKLREVPLYFNIVLYRVFHDKVATMNKWLTEKVTATVN